MFEDLKTDWHMFLQVSENEWPLRYILHSQNNSGCSELYRREDDRYWRWSVVFVDHFPAQRRVKDIEHLRKNTDIFVVHDSNLMKFFGCEEDIFSDFKYVYIYKRYKIQTALLSDTIDVGKFFEGN